MAQLSAWTAVQKALVGCRNRFEAAARNPREAQVRQLAEVLRRNRATTFGQQYDFGSLTAESEYQRRLPIHRYEDLSDFIARMAAGEENLLTAGRPIAFERTGGSSGGAKLIPCTDESLSAIQRGIFVWLDDLLTARPGIMQGRTYWSISPAARQTESTASGVPLGFPSDAAYFGPAIGGNLAELLAVPPSVGAIQELDQWRNATLEFLLAAKDLTLISVWSPTFLLELLRDVDAVRWPALDTISCWTDSSSRPFACELAARFPDVHMQGKGLLATEGVITIPMEDCAHPVLAVESGFFEFLDDSGRVFLCDEVKTDQDYRVLITNHAGLYRYAIGDRVRVRGWFHGTPMLEFLGRDGLASDLCGEKLTDAFVAQAFAGVKGFAMLAPQSGSHPHYRVYLDSALHSAESGVAIAAETDMWLRRNPQYRYARDLGQLGPVEPALLNQPLQRFYERAGTAGKRLGDIKVPALCLDFQ